MASPVASSTQAFAFLNGATGPASDAGRTRDTASGSNFSDMLRGQLRAGAPEQSAQQPTRTAPRVPERTQARTPEREPSRPAAEAEERSRPQGSEAKTAPAPSEKPAASGAAGTPTAAPSEPAAAPETTAKVEASTLDAADPATSGIAGLPAAIAALLPTVAAQASSGTPDLPGEDGGEGTDLSADLGLASDTRAKSLQNPAGAKPALFARAEAAVLPTPPGLVLAAKPEVQSAFADRPGVALQPLHGDLPAADSGSLMHTLRQTGQLQAATPQLPVATPAGQRGWAEDVGNRVMWMVGRAESKAELVLTPPNMGKVEVSINLNGDQTTAQFVAATQAARDALEQAMPRLREILAQSGISLGQTSVNTSAEQQAGGEERGRNGHRGSGASGIEAGEAGTTTTWARQSDGLVDTFA